MTKRNGIAKRKVSSSVVIVFAVLLSLFVSCANMGSGPQGGPKDYDPPKYVKSTPNRGQLNAHPERVEIFFDEYVEIKNGQEVVVTPPFPTQPEVKAIGKKVVMEFKDSLKENTTYVIDFSNSIVDYRESNPLPNYCFEFSTGNEIDSFTISGFVVDAETLVPSEGILVGAYKDWNDTLFKTSILEHVARTKSNGRFVLRGLKPQPYHIVALKDGNSNFMYDSPGEYFGVIDTVVTPYMEMKERCDTIFKRVNRDSLLGIENGDETIDTLIVDTVKCSQKPYYYPDSLEFSISQRYTPIQEYVKGTRTEEHSFVLRFNNAKPHRPTLTLLNHETKDSSWYILNPSVTTDTMTYFLADTALLKKDTLEIKMDYLVVDSTENFVMQTDTITLLYRRPKKQKSKVAPKVKAEVVKDVEIGDMPAIKFDKPVKSLTDTAFYIFDKSDTTKTHLPFTLEAKENFLEYAIKGEWKEGANYVLKADSGAIHNIYGVPTDSLALRFKMKKPEDYSNLKITLKDKPSGVLYMELITNNMVMRRVLVGESNEITFKNLKPATYVVSLWRDSNENGKWDAGDFEEKRQPEEVWFFHKSLTMSAGWDYDEEWQVGDRLKCVQRPSGSYPPKKK